MFLVNLFVETTKGSGHQYSTSRMDKDRKRSISINSIKNQEARVRLWQQIKHKKKLEKKERRVKKEKARKELGEDAPPKEVSGCGIASSPF